MHNRSMHNRILAAVAVAALSALPSQAQFEIQGGGRANPDDFEVTTFADDLNYPVGMVELTDHSILVAVSKGSSFFSSS